MGVFFGILAVTQDQVHIARGWGHITGDIFMKSVLKLLVAAVMVVGFVGSSMASEPATTGTSTDSGTSTASGTSTTH